MNVLLINPWTSGVYYRLGFIFPPLGLTYLSASLKKAGYGVRIIDMNVERFDYVHYDFSDWDLVGITADTIRFKDVCNMARIIKQKNVTVVLGGPHASADPINILKNRVADYVILGEGERTIVELVNSLKEGERFPDIYGLAYIKNGEFKIKSQKYIRDLDTLPLPDRDSLHLDRYKLTFVGKHTASMITSRGCPFNCEFCSASQFMGLKWRRHSIERSIDEMKLLRRYGYGSVIFFDDNFTMDPQRTIKLSEEMIRNNLNFKWWAFTRADEVLGHEDMVEAMAASGCKMVFIGFESADDSILKEFNKKLNSSIAFDVVKILKKYKINLYAAFILGAIHETKNSIMNTIKFAQLLNPKAIQFSILTPYPGTRLFNDFKNKLITTDWHLFDGTHLVFKHPNFSPDALRKQFLKAYVYLYKNPGRLVYNIDSLFKLVKNSFSDISKYYEQLANNVL